ncbi:hypothetical protein PAPHI01_2118 [Pancytospora philotis]|nr:hypothetical protein PAPHI01_2118 [Pancytospora philotis]
MPDVTPKIYLEKCGKDAHDLAAVAAEHPAYTKVFMSVAKTGNRTRLALSKSRGDRLYLVSEQDCPSYRDCIAACLEKAADPDGATPRAEDPPAPQSAKRASSQLEKGPSQAAPKKAKQSNLLSYFTKN